MNIEQCHRNTDHGGITRLSASDQKSNVKFSTLPRQRLVSDLEKRMIVVEKILQELGIDQMLDPDCEL